MLDTARLVANGFRPYRKTTVTFARQMAVPFSVKLDSGDRIRGKPGDFACIGPGGSSRWIVDREVFTTTYDLQPIDRTTLRRGTVYSRLYRQGFRPYRKRQITWAKQIKKARVIKTIEGYVHAYPGDYLCIGPNGDQWPQPAARFEANYKRVVLNSTG